MSLTDAFDALARQPADRQVQRAAVMALMADVDAQPDYRERRVSLHRRLLLAESPPDVPPVYAQELCRLLTSSQHNAAHRLAQDAEVSLHALLRERAAGVPAILFLLVGRSAFEKSVGTQTIKELHEAWFPRLSWQQTTLPYNTTFGDIPFQRNADELLSIFWPSAQATVRPDAGLRPEHVVLLDWLSPRSLFADATGFKRYRSEASPPTTEDGSAALRLLESRYGSDHDNAFRTPNDRSPPKPELAIRAAYAAAACKVPALRPRRRPRVAICVSGQLRGYEQALRTWQNRFLPLIEPVFVIHSWTRIGRAGADVTRSKLPFRGEAFTSAYRTVATRLGMDETRARYPSLFRLLELDGEVEKSKLEDVYATDRVVLENDQEPRFQSMSNSEKMHYKIHAADLLGRTLDCDLRMRIRPDKEVRHCAVDFGDIASNASGRDRIFADLPLFYQYGHLAVGDQVALGLPEPMTVYAGTWETYGDFAAQKLLGVPDQMRGHTALAMTLWCAGITATKLPLGFGGLLEAEELPSRSVLEAIEADYRGTLEDKALLEAARADAGA